MKHQLNVLSHTHTEENIDQTKVAQSHSCGSSVNVCTRKINENRIRYGKFHLKLLRWCTAPISERKYNWN